MPAGTTIPILDRLYTNRLLLRKILREDLETLLRWSETEASFGSFLSPEKLEREELEQKYSAGLYWGEREKLFLITTRDNIALGTIHYWLPAEKINTAVVAVKIAEPHQRNKGYGTEAQKSLLIFLFEKEKVKYVDMYTDLDNLPQQRCLAKLGFSLIETLTYDDGGIRRTGNLYRLDIMKYQHQPIYRYHYE